MTRSARHVPLALVLALLAASCAAPPADQDDPFADGKADWVGLVNHDSAIQEIGEIGTSFTATKRAHAWTFTLGMTEQVSMWTALFSGSTGKVVDTVIYLYRKDGSAWGHYINKNDNSNGTKWSRLEVTLPPGEYRVIVAARTESTQGEFAINLRCADGFCDYYDPNEYPDPEDPGVGQPDDPGTGAVSFRLPLHDEQGRPLSVHNDALQAKGLPTFPDFITVSSTATTPAKEFERYVAQAQREDVLAVTDSELEQYADPASYLDAVRGTELGLCYTGNGAALAGFFQEFSDSIFSDQFVVYGWRTATKSAYDEWHEPTRVSAIYEEWTAFDATSDDVLVIFSTDDDGTERTATVPHCR
jgi:hypothetical protein